MPTRGRRSRTLGLGLALLLLATGAACGDDDDEAADTTTTEAASGAAVVDIEMKDFAYTVSGALTEGGALRVKNTGKEIHMITVTKFKPGKTVTDLVKAFQEAPEGEEEVTTTTAARAGTTTSAPGGEEGEQEEDDPTADIVDDVEVQGGAGIYQPGAPAMELTPIGLEAGDYALMCFINVAGSEELHVAEGMVATLKVVEGTAPPAPTADTTFKLEKGKAITGPATLTSGRHIIKFEATGADAGDLEPALYRANPGTTLEQADRVFKSWDESGIPADGVSKIPGLLYFSLFDLGEQTPYYVTTELTAGTYYIIGEDTDDDDEVFPPKELIRLTVT